MNAKNTKTLKQNVWQLAPVYPAICWRYPWNFVLYRKIFSQIQDPNHDFTLEFVTKTYALYIKVVKCVVPYLMVDKQGPIYESRIILASSCPSISWRPFRIEPKANRQRPYSQFSEKNRYFAITTSKILTKFGFVPQSFC